jgi:2-dehydropantoate 2-reductase
MAKILIVGDGAIGLLMSHFLAKYHTVHVLTRKSTTNTRFYSTLNTPSHSINAQFINLNHLNNIEKPDIVLFTVKAFDVLTAFTDVKAFLPQQCSIVISHNGMGNVEHITPQLNKHHALYFLTTSMAGFKANQYIVQHTGNGQSVIGAYNNIAADNLTHITEVLSAIPLLKETANIHQLRFEKLLVNIAINPLSALYNIKNGQLRDPAFNSDIFNLLTEACNIALAQGLNIRLVDALNNAYKVMMLTANNYSSMHQDVMHCRDTEISAICGYISQQGKELGIKTPYNDAIFLKIHTLKSAAY